MKYNNNSNKKNHSCNCVRKEFSFGIHKVPKSCGAPLRPERKGRSEQHKDDDVVWGYKFPKLFFCFICWCWVHVTRTWIYCQNKKKTNFARSTQNNIVTASPCFWFLIFFLCCDCLVKFCCRYVGCCCICFVVLVSKTTCLQSVEQHYYSRPKLLDKYESISLLLIFWFCQEKPFCE